VYVKERQASSGGSVRNGTNPMPYVALSALAPVFFFLVFASPFLIDWRNIARPNATLLEMIQCLKPPGMPWLRACRRMLEKLEQQQKQPHGQQQGQPQEPQQK
jgi:hypothetical protein